MLKIKAKIEKQIENLENSIAASDVTLEDSRAAQAELSVMFDHLTDVPVPAANLAGLPENFEAVSEKARRASEEDHLARLQATLASNLMVGTKSYIVSNEKNLVSPAGFHPSEKVFVQTRIAIHTDSLDNLPASNVKLFSHKIGEAA